MVRHHDFSAHLYINGQLPTVEPFQTNVTQSNAYTTIPFLLVPDTKLMLAWEDQRTTGGGGAPAGVFAECSWDVEGAARRVKRVGPKDERRPNVGCSQEWVAGEGAQRGIVNLSIQPAVYGDQGVLVPGPNLVGFHWKLTPPPQPSRPGPSVNGSPSGLRSGGGASGSPARHSAQLGHSTANGPVHANSHPHQDRKSSVTTALGSQPQPIPPSLTGTVYSHPSATHSMAEPIPKRRHTYHPNHSAIPPSPEQHTPRLMPAQVGHAQHGSAFYISPVREVTVAGNGHGTHNGVVQANGMVARAGSVRGGGWGVQAGGPGVELRLRELKSENDKLRREWEKEKENSRFYEQSVAKLYARLTDGRLVEYLSERLRTEDLSPTMRVSVAVAKAEALANMAAGSAESAAAAIGWVVGLMEAGLQGQ